MRHYYDDPLAAAWMTKHFGMNLQWQCADMHAASPADFADAYMNDCGEVKYYIHPDSLYLLEPIDGDLIMWVNKRGFHYARAKSVRKKITLASGATLIGKSEVVSIIQRKAIPFHWPKQEA